MVFISLLHNKKQSILYLSIYYNLTISYNNTKKICTAGPRKKYFEFFLSVQSTMKFHFYLKFCNFKKIPRYDLKKNWAFIFCCSLQHDLSFLFNLFWFLKILVLKLPFMVILSIQKYFLWLNITAFPYVLNCYDWNDQSEVIYFNL